MRSQTDIAKTIDEHGNAVWRVCVLYFGNSADAQDAFQDAMIKYSLADQSFNDQEHCKAWLIRVTTNICKDMVKAAHRKNVPLEHEELGELPLEDKRAEKPDSLIRETLSVMRSLTDPPRTPLYLSLYEGYTAPEIAQMLDAPVNTVYSWIARGKQQLKEVLG